MCCIFHIISGVTASPYVCLGVLTLFVSGSFPLPLSVCLHDLVTKGARLECGRYEIPSRRPPSCHSSDFYIGIVSGTAHGAWCYRVMTNWLVWYGPTVTDETVSLISNLCLSVAARQCSSRSVPDTLCLLRGRRAAKTAPTKPPLSLPGFVFLDEQETRQSHVS